MQSCTRENITLFWSVDRFSFPKRRFWRIGGHGISLEKRRRMSASRGVVDSFDRPTATYSGESTIDLRWRSKLSELQPSRSRVCRIWALRDPKLNIDLDLDIFELRDCLKEVREGRLLTLRGRSFQIHIVAGRNEFWYVCVLAVIGGILFAVLRLYRVCWCVGRRPIRYFGESEWFIL